MPAQPLTWVGRASGFGRGLRVAVTVCVVVFAACFVANEAQCATEIREIVASSLNVRAGPSLKQKRLDTLPRGALVLLLAKQPKWAEVQLEDGRQGWVAREYLSLPKVDGWQPVGRGWINANSVNIRSGPSTQDSVKGSANKGTLAQILKKMGKWYYVRINSPLEGWVAGWLVNVEGRSAASAPQRSAGAPKGDPKSGLPGNRIVATAMKYLGRPYHFGGTSAAGFDCSGFVYHVMAELGKRLPRRGRDMIAAGSAVSRENMQAGDVIFFVNTYRRGISHVGIYLGADKFIHASSAGGSVIVTPLSKSYYSDRFCGARRM